LEGKEKGRETKEEKFGSCAGPFSLRGNKGGGEAGIYGEKCWIRAQKKKRLKREKKDKQEGKTSIREKVAPTKRKRALATLNLCREGREKDHFVREGGEQTESLKDLRFEKGWSEG